MEDTTAEPDYLAVLGDTREPDYLVMDATREPDYIAVIDDTREPDYLAVLDDTREPDYLVMDATREPDYIAFAEDETGVPAYTATYHGTAENASESTRTDQENSEYGELDTTQVYDDIVDIAPSSNTATQLKVAEPQLQVVEPQTRSRCACKIPRLILKATIFVLAVLLALHYSLDLLKLIGNSTKVNNNNNGLLPLGRVTSAKYMHYFTVNEILKDDFEVNVLSVSNNGQLLVGAFVTAVYTTSGSHVTTLHVYDGEFINDAAWTPNGNIVCTTAYNVIVLSISGDILTESGNVNRLSRVTVSHDGDIYVSSGSGVYVSTDDGKTWSIRFSIPDNDSFIRRAMRVSSDQYTDIFWTLEYKISNHSGSTTTQLYMYTLHKAADNAVKRVTRSNDLNPTDMEKGAVRLHSLSFDGQSTIFALDFNTNDVFMWSVNGTYDGLLQLSLDKSLNMLRVTWLAVDGDNKTMYAGLWTGPLMSVGVFSLH